MLVYSILFLAAVLVLLPWLASRIDVHWPRARVEIGPVRWLGVILFSICMGLYATASLLLSRHGRGAYVEFDPPREFVAVGPFQWCRNPIAGSLLGMLLGEALAFSSTGIFLLFLVALPLAQLQVVCLEEPLLRKRFGQAYEEYVRRVPRWLPGTPRRAGP
jgi:protein-S-isoprenylcysteine O-methyltransferase Ste14